jgi:hypothetical protein
MASSTKALCLSLLPALLVAGFTNSAWAQETRSTTGEGDGISNCEQLFENEGQYREEMLELERRKQDALEKFGEREKGLPESAWSPEQENRLNSLKAMFNNCQ